MKHLKYLFLGIVLTGSIHAYALPYCPNAKIASVYQSVNPIYKEHTNAFPVPSSVLMQEEQQISGVEYAQDKNPKPGKKRNPFKERRQIVIGISQATGDVLLEILEVAIDIATQFCY